MITKDTVQKHLSLFKIKAKKKFLKKKYKESFKYLELFAKLSYHYNIKYTDNEAEALICQICKNILVVRNVEKKSNRIVFYDSFAIDNRGLTQQYLRAIISWGSELLFITNTKIGADITKELVAYPKAIVLNYNKNNLNEYNQITKQIIEFCPEKVFLHFSPWDISGFCLWNSIKNVDRFLINLTDHAFWLGKSCTDFILEFRRYGIYLSTKERGIPINKLLLQPYYPIISKKKFQGFPFKKDKIIAFAGSSFYKISGQNNLFLKLIKEVLIQNESLIFALAGSGNKRPITKFINENNLNERFFLLGNRSDISSVFENIDLYVNTFPMIGGLMSQYAAVYNKPIIGYTSEDLYGYNDVEDLLQLEQKGILVKKNKKDFFDYFHQLINNQQCREENVEFTKECVLPPEEFSKRLYKNIYKYEYIIDQKFISDVKFDSDSIANLYIDMENSYLKEHYIIIGSVLKMRMFLWFPAEGCKYFISGFLKRIRRGII